jgi:hypothetical protein
MAKAYLGKISALVTANTSDFNSKLNASAKEVRSFAKSMQTSLTRAQSEATSALRGIYTESQKVSRALQAVATQRLSFKGFDTAAVGSIRQAVDQFKALQQAAVAVNEPLSRAARAVEKLSAPVQLGFEPALKSAQKSAEYLNSALTRGGIIGEKSFERIERRALAAAQAADRLAEAAQMASAGPRGTELAFAAPRVRDSLAASADVRQRAAAAPASVLEGGRVANDVQKLVAIDNLIQKRRAEIESGTILNIDTTRAQASLESLLQVSARVRAQVGEALESANVGAASTVDATGRSIRDRIRDIASLREAEASLNRERELAANIGASSQLASTVDATGRSIRDRIRDIAALREAEASLNRERELAANVGASSQLASTVDATGRSIRDRIRDIASLREAEASANRERENAANVGATSQRATQLPADYFSRRLASSAADSLGAPLDAATRQLEQFRSGIVSAKSQLDAMPAAVRSHFIPAIQGAEQEFIRLVALGPRATAEEIENAARNMDTLTAAVRRTTQAAQVQSFGDFINDANVRQSVGELQGLQRVLIQVGAVAGGPAARAYEAYRARLQEAISTGTTGLPTVRRELERLQRAAAEAAAATGRISVGNAFRQIQRAGDVARGGVDRFSLALNQAAFAVDDFFSATGGLEFKLRAVSNNITQLAFILGGTTGLFLGLGAVITGQVAVALAKHVFGLDDAKKRQEALKAQAEALNSTLDKQKNLVEALADAYRDLGRDIKQATLTPQNARFEERQNRDRDVRQQQAERRREQVAGIIPAVAANRGRRQQLEAQAAELPLGQERAAVQRRADRLRAREDDVFGRVERVAAGRLGQNRAGLEERRGFFQERLNSLQADRARVARNFGEDDPRLARFDAQINTAAEQLAEFTLALQRINDEAISTAFQFSGPLQDSIQRAQERLASAFGDRRVQQQDTLDRAGRALGDLPSRITTENLSPAGTRRAIAEIEALARPAVEAASRLGDFADALTSAEGAAKRADEQAKARVEELRAEVSRNPNDRGLQAQLRAAESGATEVARRRQQVEADVRRGFAETGAGADANRGRQQQVQRDADAASRFAQDLTRQGELISRGFEIARPAIEEFARKLEQDLTALGEAARSDRQDAAKILEGGRRNLTEQAAPMLVDMANSVQNAVLQGPSRAALTASDVTTTQGAQELNRLLRGDAAGREADFVEMQKQTTQLQQVNEGIKQLAQRLGVAQ